ncbi:MAG: DUF2911 domain-containing protein [Saprospiraceae bacterium]|nr:MAG: DUF2911 domain-containing protein [Saprospiraceae bacterium]
MKKLFFPGLLACAAILFTSETATAQEFPPLDKSPMDIASFPARGSDKAVKVVYSRPQKNGREIFGGLEALGKVWRTGANEATEITFYKNTTLGGKAIKAGTYSLFTIPEKDKWTVILNSELNQWGAYEYKESSDVLRYEVPVQKTASTVEAFSIVFEKTDNGANMVMAWDDTMVSVPFVF